MSLPWRLAILLTILIIVYCWKSSQLIIAPKRFVSPYTPADFGLNFIPVKITTKDNIELDVWFIPADSIKWNPKPAIILCHGFGADKGDLIDIARFLHPADYNIVMFDFRAHGKSEGKYSSLGYYECRDISAIIKWLHQQGINRIGAFGVSMGGTTALFSATQNQSIQAVVTDGAYISFWSAVTSFARAYYKAPKYPFIPPAVWTAGMRLKFKPSKLNLANYLHNFQPGHALIIHGNRDEEISPKDAYQIYSSITPHSAGLTLWIIKGARHLESHKVAKQEYERKIIEFFNSILKKA